MFNLREQAITNGYAQMQIGNGTKTTVRLEYRQNGAGHFRLFIGHPLQRVDPLLEWAIRGIVFAPEDAATTQRDQGIHKNVVVDWIEGAPEQMALPV